MPGLILIEFEPISLRVQRREKTPDPFTPDLRHLWSRASSCLTGSSRPLPVTHFSQERTFAVSGNGLSTL
mgnify:CR=1 FL=1